MPSLRVFANAKAFAKVSRSITFTKSKFMPQSYVYIVKCNDTSYYVGVTSNLTQRLSQHNSGFFPTCYTFKRRPIELVFYCEFADIRLAIDKEKKIKKWSRAKKEALINGDFGDLVILSKKKF